jgi:hypothetical protein
MSDDSDRPFPNPLGPDAPREDYVGLAFRTLAFSVALGVALIAVVTWGVRTVQLASPPSPPSLGDPHAVLLLGGLALGFLGAGLATWFLLAPIGNAYRRGMLAVVSMAGAFLFGLVTQPIDLALGRSGLAGLAVVAAAICIWLGRGIRTTR